MYTGRLDDKPWADLHGKAAVTFIGSKNLFLVCYIPLTKYFKETLFGVDHLGPPISIRFES
ncbi:MAG: hypothetical protein JW863_08735 [Chitinispirillaceae bacterium]|nr:hypothetical protein [Chitinispirillaceae bacterium]